MRDDFSSTSPDPHAIWGRLLLICLPAMHRFLLAACFILPLSCRAQDFIAEFDKAWELKQQDDPAAAEGMQRSFKMALSAGDMRYASAAGLNFCEGLYRQGKVIEGGKAAREVLDALQPFAEDTGPLADRVWRSAVFGYMERGLMAEGKLGAAWQANRAGTMILGGKPAAATEDGRSIMVADLKWMSPVLRPRGWRLLERESDYLDYAGRSIEARTLLDDAAVYLKENWGRLEDKERFYALKVLASRAELMDFLGYQAEALAAEEELLALPVLNGDEAISRLTLRLNSLRNRSQWEGPSEELLEQARGLAKKLTAEHDRSAERLIAKMELDLRDSQAARDDLAADAKRHVAEGYQLEAAYAGRDSLIARAAAGEKGLDAEFVALLMKMRALGSKRGEPFLYREYAEYLLGQDRAAEAIPLYAEALRLTRSFHWTLHEPALLLGLFNARLKAGDIEGARAVMAELEAWLKENGAAPAQRRALAWNCVALQKARLGDKDAAHAAYEKARAVAKDLPDFQKRSITPEMEKKALAEAAPLPAAVPAELPRVRLQPLEVYSTAVPGTAANTRFVIFNPAGSTVRGKLVIEGPGAEVKGDKVSFRAGAPSEKLELPRSLAAGGDATLLVSMAAGTGVAEAQVKVSWATGGKLSPASTWTVRWAAEAKDSVVLDASLLEANPFRSVSLFHEIAVPVDEFESVPFRLRSPEELRFEYYDSRSGELLAIDANGNGRFSDAGDLYLHGRAGVEAALLQVRDERGTLGVEVRIYAPSGEPLPVVGKPLGLESEIYHAGEWVTEADSILR